MEEELILREEDWIANIAKGGPGSICGPHNRTPLEVLLEEMPGFSLLDFEIVRVRKGREEYNVPVLFLKSAEGQGVVCVRTIS